MPSQLASQFFSVTCMGEPGDEANILHFFSVPPPNIILCTLYMSGTPRCHLAMDDIIGRACLEAEVYRECGVHGIIVENMHDTPYLNGGVGAEVIACMTRVASGVRRLVPRLALGVQVLSGEHYEW